MVRSGLAASLVFAGVWLLAGPGWGLVAGGCLVFALWPQGTETALASAFRRAAFWGRRAGVAAAAAPRRAAAVLTASGGLMLIPLGLALSAAGAGIAVAAAGGLLTGGALLLGWDA